MNPVVELGLAKRIRPFTFIQIFLWVRLRRANEAVALYQWSYSIFSCVSIHIHDYPIDNVFIDDDGSNSRTQQRLLLSSIMMMIMMRTMMILILIGLQLEPMKWNEVNRNEMR